MPLAATIPASCLQYHNPSWSRSPSESPSVFIFPLERELSSQPGRGRSCHPPSDGWLFMTTRSPGPRSPRHKPAPGRQAKWPSREPEWGVVPRLGLSWPPQFTRTFPKSPTTPKRQAHTVPAFISFYLEAGICPSTGGLAHAELSCALFLGDFTAVKSAVLWGPGGGGAQVPPECRSISRLEAALALPCSPGLGRRGSNQGSNARGGGAFPHQTEISRNTHTKCRRTQNRRQRSANAGKPVRTGGSSSPPPARFHCSISFICLPGISCFSPLLWALKSSEKSAF